MGGLYKKMPLTYGTFLVSTLALTGVPCFSGYFTKDTIIANALEWGMAKGAAAYLPFIFSAVAAFMTMFYMMRLILMTFHGKPQDQEKFDHAHESPPVMTIPLICLAALAFFGAGTILPWHTANNTWYADLVNAPDACVVTATDIAHTENLSEAAHELEALHEGMEDAEHSAHYIALGVSLPLVVFGFLLALAFYKFRRLSAEKCAIAIRPVYNTIKNKYYLDEFNDIVFVRGLIRLCSFINRTLEAFIDFLVNLAGWITRFVSFIHGLVDKYIVDGLVNFWWWFSHALSGILRVMQTGSARDYLTLALLGVVIVSLVMLFAI